MWQTQDGRGAILVKTTYKWSLFIHKMKGKVHLSYDYLNSAIGMVHLYAWFWFAMLQILLKRMNLKRCIGVGYGENPSQYLKKWHCWLCIPFVVNVGYAKMSVLYISRWLMYYRHWCLQHYSCIPIINWLRYYSIKQSHIICYFPYL